MTSWNFKMSDFSGMPKEFRMDEFRKEHLARAKPIKRAGLTERERCARICEEMARLTREALNAGTDPGKDDRFNGAIDALEDAARAIRKGVKSPPAP